jgi:Region found in RelA / SpoT proteins
VAFPRPSYSRGQVNKAGDILRAAWAAPEDPAGLNPDELLWALEVLGNWRACHNYPVNTFQATLRSRLKGIDREATVAQRLKRLPSIIGKLMRFPHMELARMQDIGGLRAIVESVAKVRELEMLYLESKFQHQLVTPHKDYIQQPKSDGYRGIHLVYKYRNEIEPAYDGLQLELQLRTRLQHAWATAVETMGTFLGQALKSGQGEGQWRSFFAVSGAAIALLENSPPVPGYEQLSEAETFGRVAEAEEKLHVLQKLRGFSIAADRIKKSKGHGAYHLVVLDSASKSVVLTPYSTARLEEANAAYSKIEKRTQAGESIEAVLVAAGPVDALKKAYPNYFLDTHEFIGQIERVIQAAGRGDRTSYVAHRRASVRPK